VPRVRAAGPSGCTYWKQAALGAFYTEAADHYNCPIGAYTHGVTMPPDRAGELEGVIGTMLQLGYIRPEEVPAIPRREEAFRVVVYAPLDASSVEADLVLVCGNSRRMMLLAEAAQAAGIGVDALMGRPTCAAVAEVLRTQRGLASLGCIGNRVYTELADDELYFVMPGKKLEAVIKALATIVDANRELEKYHRGRMALLTT
jgi:uncharacterized protein (DUF169 family)